MSDLKCSANPDVSSRCIKDAVCINTSKVYDSCADKDCLADLRVYLTDCAQDVVDYATSVRVRDVDVLNVFTDIEKVPFNSGYYSIDLTFFFKVTLDVFTTPVAPPTTIHGLAVYSKKIILFGSEGSVKVFSSEYEKKEFDDQLPKTETNPRVVVQVAEPVALDSRLCRPCDCCNNISDVTNGIPGCIKKCFAGQFVSPSTERAVRVTIGLFSIVQLERDVQILIPAYDFCIPTKDCTLVSEDACDAFRRIKFPIDEFFPPCDGDVAGESDEDKKPHCGCKPR
ncbi:MAG: hypothetical protein GX264_09325 [Clostridiales bacterium]|jgi:hypothetical protein|nr:hypothetical protein [Clostridiales bacterium]